MSDETIHFELSAATGILEQGLYELNEQDILKRVWNHDHTVWKAEPDEITNRLGWLHEPAEMKNVIPEILTFTDEVRTDGFVDVVLLGMGGSSLAAEVIRNTFGIAAGYPQLSVLDSTDPGAILKLLECVDLSKTLFLVSTKSGSTVETLSLFNFMYSKLKNLMGADQAGMHFAAVTDSGSSLEVLAKKYNFRRIFLNNAQIGGRYSALSYFGLVPAGLIGVDIDSLLDHVLDVARENGEEASVDEAPAVKLGVALGELAAMGRDKLTFITSPSMESFGDWVEQLLAESTGKDGKGIVPIVGEDLASPQTYSEDRGFVWLHLKEDDASSAALHSLREAGHPVIEIILGDLYDLGGQFFLWEMATAIAGQRLGINPFDQPNVESAKVKARQMVVAYQEQGHLLVDPPRYVANGIEVYWNGLGETDLGIDNRDTTLDMVFNTFLGQAGHGAYLALQAYLPATDETCQALSLLRHTLRERTGLATTLGFGPRFLHSTGQLHKGDAGQGLFIQITADKPQDLAIPDVAGEEGSSITFGTLIQAQALGDQQALHEAGREIIQFHLSEDVQMGIQALVDALTG